jgi:nucleoside-triphosphatase THEP1
MQILITIWCYIGSRIMTIIVVTGTPRVGKTTIVMCIANKLKARGIKVGGVVVSNKSG